MGVLSRSQTAGHISCIYCFMNFYCLFKLSHAFSLSLLFFSLLNPITAAAAVV